MTIPAPFWSSQTPKRDESWKKMSLVERHERSYGRSLAWLQDFMRLAGPRAKITVVISDEGIVDDRAFRDAGRAVWSPSDDPDEDAAVAYAAAIGMEDELIYAAIPITPMNLDGLERRGLRGLLREMMKTTRRFVRERGEDVRAAEATALRNAAGAVTVINSTIFAFDEGGDAYVVPPSGDLLAPAFSPIGVVMSTEEFGFDKFVRAATLVAREMWDEESFLGVEIGGEDADVSLVIHENEDGTIAVGGDILGITVTWNGVPPDVLERAGDRGETSPDRLGEKARTAAAAFEEVSKKLVEWLDSVAGSYQIRPKLALGRDGDIKPVIVVDAVIGDEIRTAAHVLEEGEDLSHVAEDLKSQLASGKRS